MKVYAVLSDKSFQLFDGDIYTHNRTEAEGRLKAADAWSEDKYELYEFSDSRLPFLLMVGGILRHRFQEVASDELHKVLKKMLAERAVDAIPVAFEDEPFNRSHTTRGNRTRVQRGGRLK
jgi:hypothetical protein